MYSSFLETPLGTMLAIGNDTALFCLQFADLYPNNLKVTPGRPRSISSIEAELSEYFRGTLREFTTPVCLHGTPFQKLVWEQLREIPFGTTRSYGDIARSIGRPTAFRAVARANSANPCAIIIPCHRVINTNGSFGGYNGGIDRKKWLLNHERIYLDNRSQ